MQTFDMEQNSLYSDLWEHGDAVLSTGVRLHYVTAGNGPLLILLHGFPEFWFSWRYQIPFLAEAGYKVVAPDMRGFNTSDKPVGAKAYKRAHLCADVMALIRFFGEEKAIIIGHDWGGTVAFSFAQLYPQATHRLVVLNGPHFAIMIDKLAAVADIEQMKRSWYIYFFQIPWLPERLMKRNRYGFLRWVLHDKAIKKEAFGPEIIDAYRRAFSQPGALTSTVNYYRAAFRMGLSEWLGWNRASAVITRSKVKVPTLVIWGEEDHVLGKELNNALPDYFLGPLSFKYIPSASHWVQQEEPNVCNEHILSFLQQHT